MADSSEKKYRVRLDDGRLVGPLSVADINKLLDLGKIRKSSQAQEFPHGRWQHLGDIDLSSVTELTVIRRLRSNAVDDERPLIVETDSEDQGKDPLGPVSSQEPVLEERPDEPDNLEVDVASTNGPNLDNDLKEFSFSRGGSSNEPAAPKEEGHKSRTTVKSQKISKRASTKPSLIRPLLII